MKLPVKLVLAATAGTLLVVGLAVGTGFAATARGSSNDSLQSTNLSTTKLSLRTSSQPEEEGARFYHQSGKVRQVIQVVSEALGMEVQDVVALMKEGKTLAQIITDNQGNVDAIVATLVDRLREGLQAKVDSGDITQEQLDQRMANAEERITALLNGERPAGMHGKMGDSQTFDGRFGGRVRSGDRRLESRDGDLQGSFRGGSALSGDLSVERGRFRAQTGNRSENLQSLLQEAVDTGRITQEQMDRRLARLLEGQPDGFSRRSFGSGFDRTTADR